MDILAISYMKGLTDTAKNSITSFLTGKIDSELIQKHFVERLEEKRFANFQKFYFKTINNTVYYFSSQNFFREFRQQYSLRGINNYYLDSLERNKEHILELIRQDNLPELYEYFVGSGKHYGSFFTKLVHTFNPEKYTAVDNQIKNDFGLERESYFISMLIISNAYSNWANENRPRIDNLKELVKNSLHSNFEVTDMKVLNLIFWSKTN